MEEDSEDEGGAEILEKLQTSLANQDQFMVGIGCHRETAIQE